MVGSFIGFFMKILIIVRYYGLNEENISKLMKTESTQLARDVRECVNKRFIPMTSCILHRSPPHTGVDSSDVILELIDDFEKGRKYSEWVCKYGEEEVLIINRSGLHAYYVYAS